MVEAAAHLVEHVIPDVPVRQWVVSFPWRLRYLLALDAELCREARKVFLRAVPGFYASRARKRGVERGRTGAVDQVQRFGSALNANVHFHALVLDGVYSAPDAHTSPSFHAATRITDAEVAKLLFTIRSRVLRLLRRRGLPSEQGELIGRRDEPEETLLLLFQTASLQGRVPPGPRAGAPLARLGRRPSAERASMHHERAPDG